jgi:hypothetical protein
VALCASDPMTGKIGCHPKIDRHIDNELRITLQTDAADRLWHRLPGGDRVASDAEYIAASIREAVRRLEAAGIEP